MRNTCEIHVIFPNFSKSKNTLIFFEIHEKYIENRVRKWESHVNNMYCTCISYVFAVFCAFLIPDLNSYFAKIHE